MTRVNILASGQSEGTRIFLTPLFVNRSMLRDMGITFQVVREDADSLYDADCVFFENRLFRGWGRERQDEKAFELLEALKQRVGRVFWVDTTDGTGTTQFQLLPYVDGYFKTQILADKLAYTRSYYSGRIYFDYIIDACNEGYPRLDLPSPGPNVGGPCLYKDGWFLVERIPYNELIGTAFRINEGMPMQIVQKLRQRAAIRKVTILGMTFKANSDDTRNSVSFKLKKQLEAAGYELVLVEPHLPDFDPLVRAGGSDAVVLMTPHAEFKDLAEIRRAVRNSECLYADIWGFWPEMKHGSDNGYFLGKEIPMTDMAPELISN